MAVPKSSLENDGRLDPAMDRRLERLGLADKPGQWTERYLLCEQVVDPLTADSRRQFEATSRFIRDLIAHRWVMTRRARAKTESKRIHYLSMEFLLGRSLRNNVISPRSRSCGRRCCSKAGDSKHCSKRNRTLVSEMAGSAGWPPVLSIPWPRFSTLRLGTAFGMNTAFSGNRFGTGLKSSNRTTGFSSAIPGKFRVRAKCMRRLLGQIFE
jgi:hypothetical protein